MAALKTGGNVLRNAASFTAVPAEAGALWLLVALEMGALIGLRRYFRRHHGG